MAKHLFKISNLTILMLINLLKYHKKCCNEQYYITIILNAALFQVWSSCRMKFMTEGEKNFSSSEIKKDIRTSDIFKL